MLKHSLLLVVWDNDAAGRAGTLSVHDAMPGCLVIGSVHNKAYRSRRITLAQNFRKLSVRHYSAGGNLTDYAVHALSILGVWRSPHWFRIAGLLEGSQDGPRRRAVSAASCNPEW